MALEELISFLERFRSKYVALDLIRVGGDGDGAYLLPDILDDISYCFSPGVSYVANFEEEIAKSHNIKSFMADASVDKAPTDNELFVFIKKFLGSRTHNNFITLSDWVEQSIGDDDKHAILQMDIEGGEYDVLVYEPRDMLARFSIMVIEFHDLRNLFHIEFLRMFSAIFEKIYHNFSICHVHPNNYESIARSYSVEVPKVMEVTFIRNDYLHLIESGKEVFLPHHLDIKNVPDKPDIVMPEIWWKHQ